MTKHQMFRTFSEKQPLLESIQDAKNYLLKRYATAKNIKTTEIPEDIKMKILGDPDFALIRKMVEEKNFPGYAPLFVKFFYDQKATIQELQEIADLLSTYKTNIAKDLDMPVLDYGKITSTAEDVRPGFEVLADELRSIPRKVKLRKLYNRLIPEMKAQFNKASEEEIRKLEEISNQLDQLPDLTDKDQSGKTVTRNAWEEFTGNARKYSDYRTYPRFKDHRLAFLEMISDAEDKIDKWNIGEDDLIKDLMALDLEVGIMYNKKGYIVISARTNKAVKAVAGDTNWCIRDEYTFWRYAASKPGEERVQLVIANKNISSVDPLSLVGITAYGDGKIYSSADRPNSLIHSRLGARTVKELLDKIGYPDDLKERVTRNLRTEADIKFSIEQFLKEGSKLTATSLIESLIKARRGILKGIMTEEQWENISGVVSSILAQSLNLKPSEFIKVYKESGILTRANLNVFDYVIGDSYTSKDIKDIVEKSKEQMEQVKELMELDKAGFINLKDNPQTAELVEEVEEHGESVLKELESKI